MQKNTSQQQGNGCSVSSLELLSVQQVRRTIAMSSTQLQQLAHRDDKLHHWIRRLNEMGLSSIRSHHQSQALAYFSECERILEYAASCGTTIDRSLIIAVLNNQAYFYHQTRDIDTAYNYLEAILYNLRIFVDAPENTLIQTELQRLAALPTPSQQSQLFIDENFEALKSLLQRKQQLSIFYLRFSGLNSQRQLHTESLHNAKESLRHMKQLCKMCYHLQRITDNNNPHVKMLLKELTTIDDEFTVEDIGSLREQLRVLSCGVVDNNQVYHQAFDNLSEENKKEIIQADVHSLFDLEPISIPDNVLEDQSPSIELSSTYIMQLKKILFIMGAYFAIAVETQQLQNPQSQSRNSKNSHAEQPSPKKHSLIAEMSFLYSLITGFTYLPSSSKLTNYLYALYGQTYPSGLLQNKQSPVMSILISQMLQSNHKKMESNMNQLKQKYKNYIVEKEMDLSQSVSRRDYKLVQSRNNWQQEKKESKKLNQLLKQDSVQTLAVPNQYLTQVQYIDSFQMANSHSATQNSISSGIKTVHSEDTHHRQAKKQRGGLALKQITECQSQVLEQTQKFGKPTIGKSSGGMLNENWGNKKVKERGDKSKSLKSIKNKSKDMKQKSGRKNASIYTNPSLATIPNSREKAQKTMTKSKSPNKIKPDISTNTSEHKKLLKPEKMPFLGSFKYSLNINPLASMKANYQSIKFNKTKSPTIFQERYNHKIKCHLNDKTNKNTSKKSSSSKKMSSKSVSLAKSQNKQMQSTAKLKIYTSMNGWSKSKKR